jgi:asparagine synthase (glutamine-hydrolysing)
MCGIAGIIAKKDNHRDLSDYAHRMGAAIHRRGPDSGGVWVDQEDGVALTHRRLAILELSEAGHQPMHSPCGRYVITFNGEIYNHVDIRDQLAKTVRSENSVHHHASWIGRSDTETLIRAFSSWGIEKTLQSLTGMFAFGIWDKKERALYLARDRMGEKPLYYGTNDSLFFFGSELKAIRSLPFPAPSINRRAVGFLMKYGYIPDPHCIYENFFKLAPGHWLKITSEDLHRGIMPKPNEYWSALTVAKVAASNPLSFKDDQEAINEFEKRLLQTVRLQTIADVSIGTFLSGGIDSSLISALAQSISSKSIKTYSIGFNEREYDESRAARTVAAHLRTDHTNLHVSAQDALDIIPGLATIYDEPFADSSQIPTCILSRLARTGVTVSLSGDGGDELFCGYTRYTEATKIMRTLNGVPMPLRTLSARLIQSMPAYFWNQLAYAPKLFGLWRHNTMDMGKKASKIAKILASDSCESIFDSLISHWDPSSVVISDDQRPYTQDWPNLGGLEENMMILDTSQYLPGDILTKVDRAAMAVGLETRVPFLDHHLFEYAWRLPMHYKMRTGESKWILRNLLYKYVPRELVDRPKMGFGVPLASWLRGPLRDWGESMLERNKLESQGYLMAGAVRDKWEQHLSGKQDWQYLLWNVLMFQSWLETNS